MMDDFNEILKRHVAKGDDTKDAVLGAAFIAVNRERELPLIQSHSATEAGSN